MKHIPILFSTEMVKALLDGRKTQTRRIVKPQIPSNDIFYLKGKRGGKSVSYGSIETKFEVECPYGDNGDILWVRETLYQEGELGLKYVADNEYIDDAVIPEVPFKNGSYRNYSFCQVPNIHMPAWAARIFLQVKQIRVERLHCISEQDAIAEGIELTPLKGYNSKNPMYPKFMGKRYDYPKHYKGVDACQLVPIESFKSLWVAINGRESWESNPWVWVVQFERIDKPKNWLS